MREPLRGREAIARLLDVLDGTWTGTGDGGFPTLEDFVYRETLRITRHDEDPLLHLEQRTRRREGDREVPSHWESGFLRFMGGGRIELVDAQSGGRAEVMAGMAWRTGDESWRLDLEAVEHAHDERMRGATRRLRIEPGRLVYDMHMATSGHPELALHLRAELTRE